MLLKILKHLLVRFFTGNLHFNNSSWYFVFPSLNCLENLVLTTKKLKEKNMKKAFVL